MATTHLLYVILFSRLLMGVSQAFIIIYAPVWINEMAPEDMVSRWMSLYQLGNIVGAAVGYCTSS